MHLDMIYNELRAMGIDAAIFHRPAELVAIVDHLPHWNGSILVVKKTGEWRLFIPDNEPEVDHLPAGRVERYPWGNASEDPWQGVINLLVNYIGKDKKFTLNNRLAMPSPSSNPGDGSILSTDFFQRLGSSEIIFTESKDALSRIFLLKTQQQIKALKHAHRVIKQAVSTFFRDGTGLFDSEIAAEIEWEISRLTGQQGVSYARGFASVQSGQDTLNAGKFNRTTGRKICLGDWIFLELGACVNGYWVDLSRTTVAGEASNEQMEYFTKVYQAVNEAVSIIKPGVSCEEVYYKAYHAFARNNLSELFPHNLGHGTGFQYHEPFPAIAPGNKEILRPGNVITIEPGLYGQAVGGGIRIEENILVTGNGYEYLSSPQTSLKG